MKITDIFSSSQDAVGILKTTRNAAAVAAAITSMTIVFAIAYGSAVEYMPRFFAYVFGFLAVSVVAFVVDYGFRQTLPLGLDLLISGYAWKDRKVGAFMFLLLGWNFIQGYSSIKLSWEGRKEAIAAIQKEPEWQDVAQVKAQVDRAGSAKIRAIDSEIRDLRQQIEREESEVEHLHPAYVDRIKSGQDRYGWSAKQLESRKRAATATLSRQMDELMTARTRAIEAETESAQLTVSSVAAVNETKWRDYQISKSRNMAYIGYFGSGCTVAVFIISLMISLLGQSEVKEVEQKDVVSPVRKAAPPHVAPARGPSPTGDFETDRAIEMLRAETERLKTETETLKRKAETVHTSASETETVETVKPETETVKGPKTVSVSKSETFQWDIETVKGAVKEAVREERPETVETVRETVETELKRKPETVRVETVRYAPPKRKAETVRETVETVRTCLNCNGPMTGKRLTAKFCADACKNEYHNAKR